MTELTVSFRKFANAPTYSEGPRHTCHDLRNPDSFGSTRRYEIFTELYLSGNYAVSASEPLTVKTCKYEITYKCIH
jgi:hypothetical protein